MAADTRLTGRFIHTGIKLHRRGKTVIGFAGDVPQALVFVDWYFDRKKREPDRSNEQGWCALVWSPETGLDYWDIALRPSPILEKFFAIGSGADLAMGAMEYGASAHKAVEIAIRRDESSGGAITSMRLRR